MLLLPIAALALMAFFFVLLMMSVAISCERRERQILCPTPERIFCGMSLSALNENGRLIWATQLPALEYLASHCGSGVRPHLLRSRYAAIARRYPALYEGHRFEEWLQFLQNSRVVCQRQGRLFLAANGQAVLEQCRSAFEHNAQPPH